MGWRLRNGSNRRWGGYVRDTLALYGNGTLFFFGGASRYKCYEFTIVGVVDGSNVEDTISLTADELASCSWAGTEKSGKYFKFNIAYDARSSSGPATTTVKPSGASGSLRVTTAIGIR